MAPYAMRILVMMREVWTTKYRIHGYGLHNNLCIFLGYEGGVEDQAVVELRAALRLQEREANQLFAQLFPVRVCPGSG